jgi:peptide methionine sulfoxide reductase MsrA
MDDAIVADVLENTPLNLNNTDEAALKLMFTISGQQKEAIQDAKGLHKERQKAERITQKAVAIEARNAAQEHQDYLDSKTDFTQYLDN